MNNISGWSLPLLAGPPVVQLDGPALYTAGPLQRAQARVRHVVRPAHRIVHGGALGALARGVPVGGPHTLGPLRTPQRGAGVLPLTRTGVQGQQGQPQPTRVLNRDYGFQS